MKFRTIRTATRKAVTNWIDTIESAELKAALKNGVIVSGGAITSMALDEPVNDYDIYFRDQSLAREVALYYISRFKNEGPRPELRKTRIVNIRGESEERLVFWIQSAGVAAETSAEYKYFETRPEWETDNYIESLGDSEEGTEVDPTSLMLRIEKAEKYSPIFFTNNAITLRGGIQLVIRFYGEPDEIHDNYDYTHCKAYYDYKSDLLSIPPEVMQCLLEKTLVYSGSLYPICSLMRLRKFLARGWRISAGELLKLAENITQVDFSNVSMLQEQLMGVDVAYMHQFITALNRAKKDKQRIDAAYIAQLLDRIYD